MSKKNDLREIISLFSEVKPPKKLEDELDEEGLKALQEFEALNKDEADNLYFSFYKVGEKISFSFCREEEMIKNDRKYYSYSLLSGILKQAEKKPVKDLADNSHETPRQKLEENVKYFNIGFGNLFKKNGPSNVEKAVAKDLKEESHEESILRQQKESLSLIQGSDRSFAKVKAAFNDYSSKINSNKEFAEADISFSSLSNEAQENLFKETERKVLSGYAGDLTPLESVALANDGINKHISCYEKDRDTANESVANFVNENKNVDMAERLNRNTEENIKQMAELIDGARGTSLEEKADLLKNKAEIDQTSLILFIERIKEMIQRLFNAKNDGASQVNDNELLGNLPKTSSTWK